MSWPAGIGTCIVTYDRRDALGAGIDQYVAFTFPVDLVDATDKIVLAAGTYPFPLLGGLLSVALPYTDNPAVQPSGWSYTVTINFGTVHATSVDFELPRSVGPTVDLSSLVPAGSSTPVFASAPFVQLATYAAKGDLLAASGASQPARIAVGSDGQVPIADSTQPEGIRWGNQTGGAPSGAAGGVLSGSYPNPGANAGTPGSSAVGDTPSAGTAASLALSDHRHGREPFGTVTAQTSFGAPPSSGAATTPSRSDHAHGTPSLIDLHARKLGLVAAPFPVECLNHTDLGASSGFVILALVEPGARTISNLGLFLATAGVTPNGVNVMALFDETGNQLAITGDMSAALSNASNNGTYVEAPLGSTYNAADGTNYYVGLLCHMVTNPLIAGIFNGSGLALPTVKGHRPQIELSGQASMPASFTVSTATASPAAYWLVAS